MRTVTANEVSRAVAALCARAACDLPPDVTACIEKARLTETWPGAERTLEILLRNAELARSEAIPACQDTGVACIFVEYGQEVFVEGDFTAAVHQGVREGYASAHLRASVVSDPLERVNTRDNTPAVIHTDVVQGDRLKITLMPKGFGSENMSRLAMLSPSDGADGVMDFVVESVRVAGPNPCPPVIVGVGIGGTFDYVAYLAKKSLLRPLGTTNACERYAAMEAELLARINALGIGPQGFGGATTALAVHIETYPTHIAGLPVAVNLCCHVSRRAEVTL